MSRILLKLSGEALAGDKHHGFDEATVIEVAKQVKKIVDNEEVELIDSVMRAFVTTYIRPEDVNGGEESNEVSKCS